MHREQVGWWRRLAYNPGIIKPFLFPRPVHGTKKRGELEQALVWLLEGRLGNVKGLEEEGGAFLGMVEAGRDLGSEPRPISVAPGNPGL